MVRPIKIAIVGSGISGLSLALALSHQKAKQSEEKSFDITLFEKKKRLGGHSRTLTLRDSQTKKNLAVDTGFIVFNEKNYPELTKLFDYLQVASQESDMTFCYHSAEKKYNFNSDRLFQDRVNLLNPRHYALLVKIFFFQRRARKTWRDIADDLSLAQWLDNMGASQDLRQRFIYPLGSAIWSMPIDKMNQYPARYFAQFFFNHGLFTIADQPQWRTVVGGSRVYVEKIKKYFLARGGHVADGDGVMAAKKLANDKWRVTTEKGRELEFDKLVFACHTDQALQILANIAHPVKEFLRLIEYKPSQVFTHRHADFMPNKKVAYACWNFFEKFGTTTMSYWMNQLQSLQAKDNFFVTLNPATNLPAYDDKTIMEHPQYNLASRQAQEKIKSLQGVDNIYFCGAYLGYGFHEDGLRSAIDLLPYFGAQKPW